MARVVGIGHQNFEDIRRYDLFYIDKTRFIQEWWEKRDSVTLITRPRRFGKTLNMSMVEQFFSVKYTGRGDLFEGLEVWQEEEYRSLQGTWPVLALSFADVKETTFSQARKKICQIIQNLYNDYDFLPEIGILNASEKESFRRVSAEMEDYTASESLKMLCGYLYRYYGKKVIVLLDEYDTPMQEAYMYGYWQEMMEFTRGIFNAVFKTNPYLERAIMTGITRISRESIFSDLNHLKVITVTSDEYSECFGFTEAEVFAALQEYHLSDQKEAVKDWYDGFIFGKSRDIYNPWSIINYLDTGKKCAYWANTSSNSLVSRLIREGSRDIKLAFQGLLQGEALRTAIDEQIVYHQLSTDESSIWSLLLASGYLKATATEFLEETGETIYTLALTNKEVRIVFEKMVRDWFQDSDAGYNDFIRALLSGSLKEMNAYMNRVALTTFSFFDTGNRPSGTEPERFYHGFVLGMIVDLRGRYSVTSNRESGFGRYDVILEPRTQTDDAIILEFKVYDPDDEKDLRETVQNALAQIEEKNYAAALTARGIPEERIRKYGFAFQGKQVLIGK